MATALGRRRKATAAPRIAPPLLDVTLQSGWKVVTRQDVEGVWWTSCILDKSLDTKNSSGNFLCEFWRSTSNEDTARADHAAFCGEFGP